jgi:hypothetical protein
VSDKDWKLDKYKGGELPSREATRASRFRVMFLFEALPLNIRWLAYVAQAAATVTGLAMGSLSTRR